MHTWQPATKAEVEAVIREVVEKSPPSIWVLYSPYMIDPYPASIERFGRTEQVYVVARTSSSRVVYFDDIEENFCTAKEANGTLLDCADYVDLRLAINEALREAGLTPIS